VLPSPLREADLLAKYDAVKGFIREEVRVSGTKGLVLGLSGGLDSSMAVKACVDAVGPEAVLGLVLPETGVTPEEDVRDASELAVRLGVATVDIDLAPVLKCFVSILPEDRLAVANLKARVRMTLLYYFANLQSRLVVGTGDRSEILLGYFTKHGDGGVDLLPLGGLYKTELRLLAGHLGLPASVVKKASSPRLWKGQTAEGELGVSYEVADRILSLLVEEGLPPSKVKAKLGLGQEVDLVASRVASSGHKREMPHICQ
jgi:NAD+ synthase